MTGAYRKPYLYPGIVGVFVAAWALGSAGGAIVNGHPTYWVAYGITLTASGAGIVFAFKRSATPSKLVPSAIATAAIAVMAVGAWWSIPLEAAEVAVAAMESDSLVTVDSTPTAITMSPSNDDPDTGLIFLPGGNIDARAYVNILRPVAEAGYEVVILKLPLGIAFLGPNRAPTWALEHPEVGRWIVAGHSLGGVVAAGNASASSDLDGLVLWASYPATDVSNPPFGAVSVFGTNDALTTLEEIEASRAELPASTAFVGVEGAIHGFFGDYGDQPGDGQPGVTRAEAQAEIVAATLAFLDAMP